MNLERLFDRRGIAVIGASTTPGKLGYEVMKNVAEYDAPAYPVNPSAEGELFDEPIVGSVTDIDGPLDLAMIAVPSPVVPAVLEECGEADVGAAVIFAGGFAETSDEGEDQQAGLVRC
jgi:acetyltransferase